MKTFPGSVLPAIALLLVAYVPGLNAQAADEKALTRAAIAKGFPDAGIDVVHHELKVDMLQIVKKEGGRDPDACEEPEAAGATTKLLETLTFDGRMALERTIPTLDKAGRPLTNFRVLTWQATAFSQRLETDILYILSQDDEQKFGEIRAQQAAKGLPADFIFDLTFDARANNKTIVKRHHGMPKGHGFKTIPPGSGSPTIRQFEACYVQMPHPSYGLIRFVPRECNDRKGQTVLRLPLERALKTQDLADVRLDVTKKGVARPK